MARATTKVDLITSANGQFEKMWKLIDSMSEELQTATFAEKMAAMGKEAHWSRDKNLRDVLIHLYEWHQLLLNWINSNREGECESFLPEPYNWKTYPVMNVEFWKKHQNTSLEDAIKMVHKSHSDVLALAEKFTDEELFSKGVYKWVGGSVLGSYFVSATASHYDWAMKKIKAHQKNVNQK